MRRVSFNTPLVVSIASMAVAAIVLVAAMPALLGALLTPSLRKDPTQARLAEYVLDHESDMAAYRARLDGRSLFFIPKPPPKPVAPRPIARRSTEPPPPPPPSGPPASYNGPSILFVLGDEVWFHNGLRVSVGEEADGVRVIASDAPWKVTLGFEGGEYAVELFKHDFPGIKDNPPQTRGPQPGLKVVGDSEQQ